MSRARKTLARKFIQRYGFDRRDARYLRRAVRNKMRRKSIGILMPMDWRAIR